MEYNDNDFIDLAINQKYITAEDAKHCLEIKKKMNEDIGIGEILKQHGKLQEGEYKVVKTMLKYKTGPAISREKLQKQLKENKTKDREFAKIALKEGLITQEQLIECVNFQRELEKDGHHRSIGYVLQRKGYISDDDLRYIEEGGAPLTTQFTHEQIIKMIQKDKMGSSSNSRGSSNPRLIVVDGDNKGETFRLSKEETTIGRVKGADIKLEDSAVSRIHCKISHEEQSWFITDMMSSHGLYVNSERVRKKCELENEDMIQIGKTVIKFKL